ncbi:phage tail protein, partial [Paraburkholderia sp. SIMBA_050]
MDALKVEIDVKQVTAALQGLAPSAMQAAWRRTLRKTAAWIKSQT